MSKKEPGIVDKYVMATITIDLKFRRRCLLWYLEIRLTIEFLVDEGDASCIEGLELFLSGLGHLGDVWGHLDVVLEEENLHVLTLRVHDPLLHERDRHLSSLLKLKISYSNALKLEAQRHNRPKSI